MDCRSFSGLTLLDLLITLAVGSVFTLVAVPVFTDVLRTSQLNSQAHVFISAVNYARTEAMTRQVDVFLCARSGDSCENNRRWESGWLVFVDENRDRSADDGEVIRVFGALEDDYTLRSNVSVSSLLFLANGEVRRGSRALPLMTFRLCSPDAVAGKLKERSREIVINATGRMRLQFGRNVDEAC